LKRITGWTFNLGGETLLEVVSFVAVEEDERPRFDGVG
jgi:hypothetical protein